MNKASVAFLLLIASTLATAAAAAVVDAPVRWLVVAAVCAFLAVLAGLRVLSQRLWLLSAELRSASGAASRSLASELHSMQVILNRFPQCSLPTTGYSMTFGNLHALMDLLDELEPDTVVEFGSGMSTILVAAWMKRRGRGMLRSFDHDAAWSGRTSRHLERHGLDGHSRVTCVALAPVSVQGHHVNWYDLPADAAGIRNIELVIVDGPPSHEQSMARLPALFALESQLAANCCIVLDDALRPEERAVTAIWRAHLPEAEVYMIPGPTGLAVFRRSTRDTVGVREPVATR